MDLIRLSQARLKASNPTDNGGADEAVPDTGEEKAGLLEMGSITESAAPLEFSLSMD